MLSGEGNAGERGKTAIGLVSKKSNLARAAHFFCTFICLCFARLQRETSRNFLVTSFMEEMSYVFSFTFFHCRSFSPCIWLVAASISHFVTAATRFSCCSSSIKCLLCFLSLAQDLCRPFSRWASLAFCLLSLFLCLSHALYSRFVDMTINVNLIL